MHTAQHALLSQFPAVLALYIESQYRSQNSFLVSGVGSPPLLHFMFTGDLSATPHTVAMYPTPGLSRTVKLSTRGESAKTATAFVMNSQLVRILPLIVLSKQRTCLQGGYLGRGLQWRLVWIYDGAVMWIDGVD